jgi:hypothetical protein
MVSGELSHVLTLDRRRVHFRVTDAACCMLHGTDWSVLG